MTWTTSDEARREIRIAESRLSYAISQEKYWSEEVNKRTVAVHHAENDFNLAKAFEVPCTYCGAPAGEACEIPYRKQWEHHTARIPEKEVTSGDYYSAL